MKWLDKSITWRTYFKVAGISMALGVVVTGVWFCVQFWDDISRKIDMIKTSIDRKFGKD